MSDDQRLESMIRSCVDHEVREVLLPAGFAERITGPRRPRRWRTPLGLAVATAAAAAMVGPVSSEFAPVDPPPAIVLVTPKPSELEGRVNVTYLPPGSRYLKDETRKRMSHLPVYQNHSVWLGAYRLPGPQRRLAWIWVFSGEVAVHDVLVDYKIIPERADLSRVPVSKGDALVGEHGGRPVKRTVLLELGPGLVAAVEALGVDRAQVVRMAEGVRVG